MKKTLTTLLFAMVSIAMFAQLDFGTFVKDIRSYSKGYTNNQVIGLYEHHYGVPRQTLLQAYGGFGNDWGSVLLALEVSNLFGAPLGDLMGIFSEAPRGNGWGVIAKRYGVKPGSREFQRMKNMMGRKNKYWKGVFDAYGKHHDPKVARRGRYKFNEKLYKIDRFPTKEMKKIEKDMEKRNKEIRKEQEKNIKDWEKANKQVRKEQQKQIKKYQKNVEKVMG